MSDEKRGRARSDDIGREIDAAEPSEQVKQAVARDLDAHAPASTIPGQTAQEPLVKSQRETEDEGPGDM